MTKTNRPRILLVGGFQNWAYDFKSDALIKHLGHLFEFEKFYTEHSHTIDHTAYDGIYLFWWFSKTYLSEIPFEKLGSGLTAHRRIEQISNTEKQEISSWFKTFTANSLILYRMFEEVRNDIVYTPNGVDIHLFKHPKKRQERPFTAAWVGNTKDEMKLFEEIIVPLRELCPDINFLISSKEEPLPHHMMPSFYSQCDCLLVASKFEGTPNPALEAAACGVPIISNAVGNMPELIRDGQNSFLVEAELEAYAAKLKLLKKDPAFRNYFGANIRQDIEKHWSWEKMAQNYIPVFETLVS